MLMYIVFILFSFAAALFLVFLWEKSWTILPPSKSRCVVLYPVKGHREDVEYLLRALLKKLGEGKPSRYGLSLWIAEWMRKPVISVHSFSKIIPNWSYAA